MSKKQPQSFEDQMQRLQDIVRELERADLPLERNVALYKEGRELARSCKDMLDRARHEIRLYGEDGEETPFTPAPSGPNDTPGDMPDGAPDDTPGGANGFR